MGKDDANSPDATRNSISGQFKGLIMVKRRCVGDPVFLQFQFNGQIDDLPPFFGCEHIVLTGGGGDSEAVEVRVLIKEGQDGCHAVDIQCQVIPIRCDGWNDNPFERVVHVAISSISFVACLKHNDD